jgi:sulfatase maturation enzyme AslB (radical SAM superfamily)
MRNYRGHDYNSGYPDTELYFADIVHIFKPPLLQQLAQNPVYGANFNGNLGDFAVSRDGVEIANYFASAGVKVNINTNGSSRSPSWWAKLAHPNIQIGFALDGLADTHALYRQDTDWHKIIENATAFIQAGGRAIWRFVPFDHNRHQEQECRRRAKELGFVGFENIYDGRDAGPVYTRSGEFSHWLGPAGNPPPIKDMLQSHVTWFDSKTIKLQKDTTELNLRCRHKVDREIYLAADGTVYPCCYLGFYPTQMNHAGNSQIKEIVQDNNALEHDLEHCLEWFDQVEQSWAKESIAAGRLYSCVNSCNQV